MIRTSKRHLLSVAAMLSLAACGGGDPGNAAGGQDAFPQAGAGMPQDFAPGAAQGGGQAGYPQPGNMPPQGNAYAGQGGQGQFAGGVAAQVPDTGLPAQGPMAPQPYAQAPYPGQPQVLQAPYPGQQPDTQQVGQPGQLPQGPGAGVMPGQDVQQPTQAQMEQFYRDAEARRRQIHDEVFEQIRQIEADE